MAEKFLSNVNEMAVNLSRGRAETPDKSGFVTRKSIQEFITTSVEKTK